MAPIVHGLERQYGRRIDFLYLDVQDSSTAAAQVRLGFQATPHFFLLTPGGQIVREWQGVQEGAVLESGLQALIGDTP